MTVTLTHLSKVRSHLRSAHAEATTAAGRLTGARQTRGDELIELIADAIAFTERLAFVVEGDARYEEVLAIDATLERLIPDDQAQR